MNNPILKSKRSRGFTFTEILIVLAIIAGVTVLVLSQADTAVGSSEISQTAGVVRTFVTAANQYRALKGSYAGITAEALGDLNLLPASVYDVAANNTISPYDATNGVSIFEVDTNGRSYYVSLDFAVSDDSAAVIRQLHEGFGGYDDAKTGAAALHTATGNLTDLTEANVADNQFWVREFD